MACFADINVWQDSVATYARCGGIFNMQLTANLPRNLPVKKNVVNRSWFVILMTDTRRVKRCIIIIWQNYGQESVYPFFAHPPCRLDSSEPAHSSGTVVQFANHSSVKLTRCERYLNKLPRAAKLRNNLLSNKSTRNRAKALYTLPAATGRQHGRRYFGTGVLKIYLGWRDVTICGRDTIAILWV